jgi:hypothetical protein
MGKEPSTPESHAWSYVTLALDDEDEEVAVDAGGTNADAGALAAVPTLQRPRLASDGLTPRHLHVATMLLNARANARHRTRNGVHVAMALAASPTTEAVGVLQVYHRLPR